MLLSFLRSAIRHLARHPFYAMVNVVGLAIGLGCVLAVASHVRGELSYDTFHEHADRIVRIVSSTGGASSAVSPRPLSGALEEHLPIVRRAVRLSRERADRVLVAAGERRFVESTFLFADPDVFDVFTIPLASGDPDRALVEPFSLVLSQSARTKYFSDENPIGQTLEVRLQGDGDLFEYTVTAVAEDLPSVSHFDFDFLASYAEHPLVGEPDDQDNWLAASVYTYVLLGGERDEFSQSLSRLTAEHVQPVVRSQAAGLGDRAGGFAGYEFSVQPLQSIHLHSNLSDELKPNGSLRSVLIFSAIALIVLLLACINFVNLTTARASNREREIGIRKVLGSDRKGIAVQFLFEALLITTVAAAFGVLVVQAVKFSVEASWLRIDLLDPVTMAMIVGLVLLVGCLAGWYPAFYLSALNPAAALKAEAGVLRGKRLRSALVLVQIAATTTLLVCTVVAGDQMRYVRDMDLGFDRDAIVVIEGTEVVRRRIEAFKQELSDHSAIEAAANSEAVPGHALARVPVSLQDAPDSAVPASAMTVGFGFLETLGLDIVAGRAFSAELSGDSTAVVLNESAASALGPSAENLVGSVLMHEGRAYDVIGIVADYHQSSLRSAIEPTVLFGPDPWNENRPNQVVAVRIRAGELTAAVDHIQSTWSAFASAEPVRYSFLDSRLEAQYRSERRDGTAFALFSGLAVAIACFGLIGLAGFITGARSVEIAIRKVNGATAAKVLQLFVTQFLKLSLVAIALAVPAGYLIMRIWLNRFAYSVSIEPLPFVYAALLTLAFVLGTTAYQIVRAARLNPAEILRR